MLCPLVAGLLVERWTSGYVNLVVFLMTKSYTNTGVWISASAVIDWPLPSTEAHSRSPHFIWIASSTAILEGECFVGYRSEVSCFPIHCWTLLGKRVAWLMTVVPNWISSYFCHKTHMKSSAVILYDRLWLGKWDLISKTLVRSIYSPCTTEWWWFL